MQLKPKDDPHHSMRSISNGQLLAAAFCHLIHADAATLDPDGVFGQMIWPWAKETFVPSPNPLVNLRVGIAFAQAERARLELLGEDHCGQ